MSHEEEIRSVASRWSARARWTVLTGAGVSAASGVPTFRGSAGLWKNSRAEDLATPEAFRRDPRTVWEWYDWRRQLIAAAAPNRAHEVLAGWSRRQTGFTLITQNVDGLHERAGTANVVRFHGSIWEIRASWKHYEQKFRLAAPRSRPRRRPRGPSSMDNRSPARRML